MATLYIVATPIGNLKDITYRAVETLKEVDVIACEDTRHTRGLLNHYGISGRLISCRSENEEASAQGIVQLLDSGQTVAYVSDAGSPGMSDPGAKVVAAVRDAGFTVIPLPGASAATTLISVSRGGKGVLFEGFLPKKPGKRRRRLEELMEREDSALVYESPFRIVKVCQEIAAIDPTRMILIGREMTKMYEEYIEGPAKEVLADLESRKSIKGEFALLIYGVLAKKEKSKNKYEKVKDDSDQ